ncbi:MAG TPA: HAD hydrolase family protein [Miltoncostaeaceae bacterium]|nr:HAD hydrolase family protein [Miltoncostaeaceae bacterium]
MSGTRAVYVDLDGTLLGAGGSLLRDGDGRFSQDGVRALRLLHEAAVPVVLTSGRSALRLRMVRDLIGAQGVLAELGALSAGYPTAPEQTVFEAIQATGVPDALMAAEPGLWEHLPARPGREGGHVFAGAVSDGAFALVERLSQGTLRLADNGRIGEGVHIFHLLPANAGKAQAVAADVIERGCDAEACLAIGDSHQDLMMGRSVGAIAIVANGARADPELARIAPWVTEGSHGAGVREAVERWLAGDAPPCALD